MQSAELNSAWLLYMMMASLTSLTSPHSKYFPPIPHTHQHTFADTFADSMGGGDNGVDNKVVGGMLLSYCLPMRGSLLLIQKKPYTAWPA